MPFNPGHKGEFRKNHHFANAHANYRGKSLDLEALALERRRNYYLPLALDPGSIQLLSRYL